MIPRSLSAAVINSLGRILKPEPLLLQPKRSVLMRPEYWYFIDTEGNLTHTNRRRRYLNAPPLEEQMAATFSLANVENLLKEMQGDMPMKDMPNPYKKDREKCILCKHNIELDYKNARLLSQFISRYTGVVYERQTTGLCRYQDEKLRRSVRMAVNAGYIARTSTEPIFYHDPKLFDPFVPKRKS